MPHYQSDSTGRNHHNHNHHDHDHSSSIEQLQLQSYDPESQSDSSSRQYRMPPQFPHDPCTLPPPQPIQTFSQPTKQRSWLCCCRERKSKSRDSIDRDGFEHSKYSGTPAPAPEQVETYYGRKWKHFPGHNRFYCGGRIITAPNIHYCFFSFSLIVVTFGLFIAFDGPFLMTRLSLLIPIISSCLFVLTIINMLRTTCSDPGILPRASQAEVEHLERSYGNTSAATYRPPPRTKEILVNGQPVKSKYCFTCKMFRPPRASHCSICDNCVERFDHHCPFLGNCIGRRNYRSFYFFVISVSLLAVMILAGAIAHLALLSKDLGNFVEALRESPTSAIVGLVSFFGMWTVIGLAGFHSYLIAVEQTTNEDIKGIFGRPEAKNPYTRGSVCRNCCFVLCGPSPPSLIDARGYVTPEFLDSLPPKSKDFANIPTSNQPQGSNTPLPVGSFGGHECMELPKPSQSQQAAHMQQNGPISHQDQIRYVGNRTENSGRQLQMQSQTQQLDFQDSPDSYGIVVSAGGAAASIKSGTFPDSQSQSQQQPQRQSHNNHNSQNQNPSSADRIYNYNSGSALASSNSNINMNGGQGQGSSAGSSSTNQELNTTTVLKSKNQNQARSPANTTTTSSTITTASNKSSNSKKGPVLDQMTMINSPLHLDTVM